MFGDCPWRPAAADATGAKTRAAAGARLDRDGARIEEDLMDRTYASLDVSTAGHVAEITLIRPEVLNRIDAQAHEDLIGALRAIDDDPAIRAVVFASTGRHFSAGGDLDEVARIQTDAQLRRRFMENGRRLLHALLDLRAPVVAAMQGDAHGLGANLVLACDAVVACRGARLSDAHVVAGMVAGDGGCVVWPQAMGMVWAKRHLLTGKPISAPDAFARGLVTDLVETAAEALPAAREVARHIASLAPLAVQGTKRALNRLLLQRAGEVFDYALAMEEATLMSEDVLEAVAAFKERRPPSYQGR
jgi:enoyl-CoA hydratase